MVKKYKVIITPEARDSLRKQMDRVRRRINDQVAKRIRAEIISVIESLETFPESKERVEEINFGHIEYRKALDHKYGYKIIYTIDDDRVEVLVVEIIYGAEDPQTLIDKFKP